MLAGVLLMVMVLCAIYGVAILSAFLLLRRIGIPGSSAIVFSFLIFGAATGILTAWVWPIESSSYCNVFASLLGDQMYTLAIEYLGDSHSAQAHDTIPWVLRVPQVYVPSSLMVSALVGLPLQWLYNRGLSGCAGGRRKPSC